jgi:putative ABC transport system substrate-binding protein
MRRREIVASLIAASVPAGSWAQKQSRISILHSGFPDRTPRIRELIGGLGKHGYENGRTATINVLGGEGNAERLATLVAQLAAQKPDVIIALTSPAAFALKQAGVTSPVVFAFIVDPVGQGLVQSLARPGGNFTGMTYSEGELGGKRLGLLLDAAPEIKRIAFLWGPQFPENALLVESMRRSASDRGLVVFSRKIRDVEDLAAAFDDATRAEAQGAVFLTDNRFFGIRKRVADLAIAHHLPSMHSFKLEVEDGGLMFYGPSDLESYALAAALADKIIKGARPSELPVEQPTRFDFAINLRTAKAFGLTLPPTLLAQADDVIE